jgi:hypothetical protein
MMTICEHLEAASADYSPLNRMLVAGYYDGATEGLAECRTCGQTYAFRKLAWDDEQDIRIFALSNVNHRFDDICDSLLSIGEADRDIVVIPPLQPAEQSALDLLLGVRAEYVLASLDLRKGIIAKKPWSGEDGEQRDWFAWLGL